MNAVSAPGDDHVFITRLDPGPGSGPTLAVKDCIDVAGVVTTAGSPVVAAGARPAVADAACLAGARAAGARIVGKTNLHELCFGATGVNPHYGTPRNPLAPNRVPGGSSSGSAVAVATGQADLALGTDTAGSIRNPAACCGVAGLKTTWGRIPVVGTRPLAPSMDTIGPIAADVVGLIAAMDLLEPGFVVTPRDAGDVRLGRFRALQSDPRIDAAVDAAVAGAGVVAEDIVLAGWAQAHQDGLDLMYAEALEVNRELVAAHGGELGADVRARFARASHLSASHVAEVRARCDAWRDQLSSALERCDAIVLPGLPVFPQFVRDLDPASNVAAVAVSFAGFPALSIPVPTGDGPSTADGTPFPASLQLIGRPDAEATLLAIGALLEASPSGASC